jgi:phosphoribosyl-ATP pyrophosphohydrolase
VKYRTGTTYRHDETQNESRADLAEKALTVATDRNGEQHPSDVATDVSDLLAHLIHFCARAGLEWDELVGKAERAAEGDLEDGPEAARDTDRFPDA